MACVSILTITVNQTHRIFLKITFLLNTCIRCIQPYLSWITSGYTGTFFRCIPMVFRLWEISLRELFTAEFHTNRRCLGLFTWVNPVRVWIKSCICTTMSLLALIVLLRHGKHNSVFFMLQWAYCWQWTVGEPLCASEHTQDCSLIDAVKLVARAKRFAWLFHRKWNIHFLEDIYLLYLSPILNVSCIFMSTFLEQKYLSCLSLNIWSFHTQLFCNCYCAFFQSFRFLTDGWCSLAFCQL